MDSPPEIINFILASIGIMLALSLAFVLFFSFSQGKFRKAQLNAQQTKIEYQEKLLHNTILTQEEERKRIAKDLHDEVGSKLNVVHLYLHQLTQKVPEAQSMVSDMLEVLNETISTTRRISHDLLPPTLESFGLQVAVEEIAEWVEQSGKLEVFVESAGQRPTNIDKLIELTLFRILSELINNTLKYADATRIHISLRQYPDKLSVRYQDNGKGFDTNNQHNKKGLGLQNIESRLQMIHGTYQFQSEPLQGMKIQIDVPSAT